MTTYITTESHGTLEGGFFGPLIQFTRMGDYTFATLHFCHLVKELALHPDRRKGRILAYDESKFWERGNEDLSELLHMFDGAHNSYLPELYKAEISRHIDASPTSISIEDEVNMHGDGQFLPVSIQDDDTISIGQYNMNFTHFGRFALLVTIGAVSRNAVPDFVLSTLEAMRYSKSPLYRDIQREEPDSE